MSSDEAPTKAVRRLACKPARVPRPERLGCDVAPVDIPVAASSSTPAKAPAKVPVKIPGITPVPGMRYGRTACSVVAVPTPAPVAAPPPAPVRRPHVALACSVAPVRHPTRLACRVISRPTPVVRPNPPVQPTPYIPPGTTTTLMPSGAKPTIKDKRHAHPLTLINRPYGDQGYTCDSCNGGDLGAAYHCTTAGCDFDCHPKCIQEDKSDECKCYISLPTLLDAAQIAMKFQIRIGGLSQYTDPDYLIQCRSMYFRFLRLLAKLRKTHPKVVMIPLPCIDVWWQSHLIRPRAYAQFCLDNFGSIVDRDMVSSDPTSPAIIATAALWKNEYKTDYVDPVPSPAIVGQPLMSNDSKESAEHRAAALTTLVASLSEREAKGELKIADEGIISHDNMVAVSAVVEDREWVPNMLLYTKLDVMGLFKAEFINECLEQYKKFLFMSDTHPELMTAFVPPYPIDWLWHTHMQHPVAYSEDSKKFAQGKLLDHTPWPKVTGAEEELRHVMCNVLWAQAYPGEDVWHTHNG